MRSVPVTLGAHSLTLRIPVPSKAIALTSGLQVEGAEATERAHVGLLAAVAVDWPWSGDAAVAWEQMWDEGIAWAEVTAAIQAWIKALHAAMGLLEEAGQRTASTFPGGADAVGDRAP